MAKGARRQKIKDVLSGSPLSPRSPPTPNEPVDEVEDDLLDSLMSELDSKDSTVQAGAADVLNEINVNRQASGASSNSAASPHSGGKAPKQDSKSRYRARQDRKAAELVAMQAPDDKVAEARILREAEEERRTIAGVCDDLGLEMHDISPDGHCLFSAIADQLALLSLLPAGQATYATTRHAAADYIQAHADDFLPFLPCAGGEDGEGATDGGLMIPREFVAYCDNIRHTGQWGGEPEIQALSRAYQVPIHVVQGGKPTIVVHSPDGPARLDKAAMISYHRRMYGLGEHYNSLRPKRKAP